MKLKLSKRLQSVAFTQFHVVDHFVFIKLLFYLNVTIHLKHVKVNLPDVFYLLHPEASVCWIVYLFVSRVTQKLLKQLNLVEGRNLVQGGNQLFLGQIQGFFLSLSIAR